MMRNTYLIRSSMKMFALALLGIFCSLRGYGQLNGYTFTNSLGTYTAISGGTTVNPAGLQGAVFGIDPINPISDVGALTASYFGTAGFGAPIGFDFKFGARTYTTFQMSTDGYIKLGGITADPYPTIITGSSVPVQFAGTAEDGRDLIAAFGSSNPAGGLGSQAGATMKYITTGTSPNKVCTIEWAGVCRLGVVGDNFNFQIKLYEGSNKFEIVYGAMTTTIASTVQATAGAVGRVTADFKKVGNTLTTTTMEAPVISPTNVVNPLTNERVQWRNGFMPSSGRTYTFDPAGSVTCFLPEKPVFTVNGNQVDISWGSSGAASYNVEYRQLPSGTFAAAPGGTGITGTSLSVTGLTAATSYEFRVQSSCSAITDWISATRTIPGPGETCGLAIAYGSVAANAGACTPTTVSAGLANDGTPTISCSGVSVLTDKWYSFVAPSNGNKIIIETTADGASNPDWALEVYSSCGGSAIVCGDDFSGTDYRPVGELCQFDYVAGQTYFVRLMQMQFYGSGPTINLCIYEDAPCPVVPVNNQCAAASVFALQPFGDCPANQAQFTTENATASVGLANPSCNGPNAPLDVWVTFNSGTNTAIQLTYSLGTATGVFAQLYSGTCAGLVPVAGTSCFTTAGSYAVTGLTASTNYFIRFWSINNTAWGTFNVCLNEPPTCPTGLGAGYVDIGDIGAGYSSGTRTTCGKDNDVVGGLLNNICGSNNYLTGEDEVFKFTVPSTGLYQVVLASNSTWVGMKLFANCPLLGQGGACVANVGSSTGSKNISNISLTAGIEYYLVVDQFAPPSCIASYEFSIGANPAPPANDNCAGAVTLTQSATCNYTTFSYAPGATTSLEPVLSGANDDDVWYKFVANSVDPEITINPSPGFYPVIEFFTACGTSPICGVFNGSGAGFPVTLTPPVALTIGQTYFFRVFHAFSGSPLTDDYDVCVTNGPGEASCVDITGFPTETETCGTFTNTAPAFQAISVDQTIAGKGYAECNFRDFDYYKITTTQAGYLTFTVNSEFPALLRIFENSGSTPGAVVATENALNECSGNLAVSFPTSKPAGTYWLLLAPQNFTDVGCASTRNDYVVTATFTVNPPAPAVNDNKATPVVLVPCGSAVNTSTLSATQSQGAVTCNGFASDYAYDVWYRFTANTSLHTVSATGSQDGVLEVFVNGTSIACSDNTAAGGVESSTINTVVGQVYEVRWYVYTEGSQPPPSNVSIRVVTPGGWSGITSNDWAVGSNWCDNTVPGVGSSVVIPNVATPPTIITPANCNNITLLSGATLVTTPSSLNVKGSMAGNGNTLTGTAPVIFSATGNSQSVLGNVTFTNVRNSNTNPGGLVFAANSNARVKGVMTADANSKTNVDAAGNLIINSDASGDGSLGVVGTGATVSGNVTVERYLPFANSAGWHFIGAPVNGSTFSTWTDDIELRATAPLGGTEGVSLFTGSQHATVYQFNEAEHNAILDSTQRDGWRIPTGAGLSAGKGFRVFMSPAMLANNTDNKIDSKGSIALGNGGSGGFSFPALNRNEYSPCFPSDPTVNPAVCNEENRGWNLIANPFPSAINWDAAGWTKPAQMNNAFFLWDGVSGGYRVYVGTGGVNLGVNASTNTNPNLIPTGQAFFVKLTTAGTYTATLKADENVKSSGSASFVRTATASNNLRVRISKVGNSGYDFDAMVRFMDGATEGFDQNIDANFMRSNRESVAFRVNNQDMILNTLPSLDGYRVVPVRSFYSGQTGQFKFDFLELNSFPATVHIYLKDRVLNSIIDVRQYPAYTFQVAANNNLNSNDRFELIFSPTAVTEVKPSINGNAVFSVYPNPSKGSKVVASMMGFENENNVVVTVTDVLGKVVYTATQSIGAGNAAEHEIAAKLSAGVYNVSCVGKNHKFTTKMVVE